MQQRTVSDEGQTLIDKASPRSQQRCDLRVSASFLGKRDLVLRANGWQV
jgi:hypothetical protein